MPSQTSFRPLWRKMRSSAVPGTQLERVVNKPDPPSWAPANEGARWTGSTWT